MTNSSQTQIASVAESTYGVTPATPAFQKMRVTGEGLKAGRQNVTSNELRPDRNVSDLIQVGGNAEGPINFELSYENFEAWLESMMFSTWASDVLKNGITQKSFTLEKLFETGATDQYFRYNGAVVNTFSLNVRAQEIVTGSFGFMAKGATLAQAAIAGATYAAAPTQAVMNAGTDFASLTVSGATAPAIVGITLNTTNNLRQKPVVGSIDSYGLGAGRFQVSGSIEAYFENKDLMTMFLAGTATDLSFKLGGPTEENYVFSVPRLKFDDAEVVAGANDQDVLARMNFVGLFDPTDGCSLKITRTPAE